jgi:hypothetical protein
MHPHQQHNIKVDAETLCLLKLVAAYTDEKQYTVLTRLLHQGWQQLHADSARRHTGAKPC